MTECEIEEIENTWITMPDGCALAARIWRPVDAEQDPVPAILEYIPYRKRDQTAPRDALTHPYVAARGYACVRVDMRGNGESEGLMYDEYTEQEQQDGLAVIDWLSRQPWCTGAVGMMGISWGGFNALQLAARQPAALKAIVTVCSSDDRFADDVHYKGGCLLNENFSWGTTMMAFTSRPPDPALIPERWRALWLDRLRNMPFFTANWLSHQHRDAYWRHGSVCEDYAAVQVPVMAVGGWADAYTNSVQRLLANLSGPKKGIVGPWIHKYPHFAPPEPRIGFLQEMLRWWDRWLKGEDTGVETDPELVAYLQAWTAPVAQQAERDGRWVREPVWPAGDRAPWRLWLHPAGLAETPPAAADARRVRSPQATGTAGGRYCPIWTGPDLPIDQRRDDGGSLVFDGPPLAAPCDILGRPVLHLDVSADAANAKLAVRLNDVAPDGTALRVTYGVYNLADHVDDAAPAALEPGAVYRVAIPLDFAGHTFAAGHRVRVAVSTAYWPLIWPAPTAAEVTVRTGASVLDLPVRPARSDDGLCPLASPDAAPPLAMTWLRAPENGREIRRDAGDGTVTVDSLDDMGRHRIDAYGWEVETIGRERYAIRDDDATSARAEAHWTITLGRDGWQVRTETMASMTSDTDTFRVEATLRAYEDDACVFDETWVRDIPRDHQ